MEIHNLMEDEVIRIIHEIAQEEEHSRANGYCTSPECQMDAACFVLNRVPQQYVTSGRGLAHLQNEFRDNPQLAVDLVTLAHEGLRRVSTVQRSYYAPSDASSKDENRGAGPAFHFPAIRGRLLDCLTFAPVVGMDVWLKQDGNPAEMVNGRWQNPYTIVEHSPGSYLFWPAPIRATEAGEKRMFDFEVTVPENNDFEVLHHFFKLEITASEMDDRTLRLTRDFMLQDLFLVGR